MPIRSPVNTGNPRESQKMSLYSQILNVVRFKLKGLRVVHANAFCLFAVITLSDYELPQRFQKVMLQS